MAHKLKICANDKLADEWIANHNIETYYIGPYENSKKVAIIWDDNTNNSSNLEEDRMASNFENYNTVMMFENQSLAQEFIDEQGIKDYWLGGNFKTGEVVLEYNKPAHDNVNHPAHYETNGIECIDAMVASQGAECVMNYCLCNAFKYIWRCQHKGKRIEDIQKAVWYLNKWQELAEKEATGDA